jgi:sodium/potassium-transporting ATPase subunit beta
MDQETEFNSHIQTKKKNSTLSGLGKFVWNSDTKEFLGRDGASWCKISLFYAAFYFSLGSFFIGMLAVFMAQMPKGKPTYYGESSTMNARGINPGLSFRPQIDVEDSVIFYNPTVYEGKFGYKSMVNSLNNFLSTKYKEYGKDEEVNLLSCADGSLHTADLKADKSCRFEYKKIFETTECTADKNFGFQTNKACILLKLNKIISWNPIFEGGNNNGSIEIRCTGKVKNFNILLKNKINSK